MRGLHPDIVGPHIAVHDPRLTRGELALDGCPLVAGSCGQARPPEVRVQFGHGRTGHLAEAGSEGRFARHAASHDYDPLHIAQGASPTRRPYGCRDEGCPRQSAGRGTHPARRGSLPAWAVTAPGAAEQREPRRSRGAIKLAITRQGIVSPRRNARSLGVASTTRPNQRLRISQPSARTSTPVSPSRHSCHRSSGCTMPATAARCGGAPASRRATINVSAWVRTLTTTAWAHMVLNDTRPRRLLLLDLGGADGTLQNP